MGDTTASRRLRLTRFQGFCLVSAALIVAVVVATGLAVGNFFERHVLAEAEIQTVEMAQNQARQHLTPKSFDAPVSAAAAEAFVQFLEGLPGVFRVKVFDSSGRIVWSNEPRLIGQRFPDNSSLQRALAGRVTTVLGAPHRSEHVFERTRSYIAEVYVPIAFAGSPAVMGVVEAYKDMSAVVLAIRQTQQRIWLVTGAAGLFLYLSLTLVVWRASASERRAIALLERRNRELVLLQGFTRSVLSPLDLGQIATSVVRSAGEGLGLSRAALYGLDAGGAPVVLAAWPADVAAPPPPPELTREALETRRGTVRDGILISPLFTPSGTGYLFVGGLSPALAGAGTAGLRTLEIMLDEAAIALANVQIVIEIREANERLGAILSGIADQMVIVGRDLQTVWVNAAAAAAGEREVGRLCYEAMGVAPEVCESCPAVRSMHSGAVERGVRAQKLPDGRTRYLDLVTAPLRDATGQVYQVLEVARDVTELVEMENRLKETNRALRDTQAELVEKERLAAVGEVVVGLHHAILNPLTGVLGALQVLKDPEIATPERTRAVADAEAEIRKIERLIRRLPDLRRAGGTPYVGKTTMLDLERCDEDEDAAPPDGRDPGQR